ncbi:MAG: HDIG domain-containing protein [Chthoniobacterales bacterium]|nr:HDIG domain-containing protein [Chthoniobacterales bacterium]
MWNFLKKRRLVDRGLDCGKRRRTIGQNEFAESLQSGWLVRSLLLGAFVAGLASLIFTSQQEEPAKKFLLCLLIFVTAVVQLWINHPQTLAINSRLCLLLGVFLMQLTAIKVTLFQAAAGNIDPQLAPLLVPYAFAPLVLSVLMGRNHGLYAAIFASLWGSLLVGRIDPVFLVISLITGFIAVYVTLQVRRRSRLIRAGVYVGIATWVLAAAFGQIGPVIWEDPGQTHWKMIALQSVTAIGTGIGTAILVSGILPMLESLFKITTDISWLEMSDLNHPLLKRLSMEAPGTYHHSLAVANLAEAAAECVGANATICRVCSYFHDIGKLVKPDYFTENMSVGHNPHNDLTPSMSALIIIAHVKEGVDLALKHKLNNEIIDIIRQHHGTSLVSYFYKRALQQQEDARLGGKIMNMREDDIPEVREESFRYPGPRPQTKEAAIINLADSIESASRSLERPTPQKIDDLVNTLVETRIAEHQLDECPLTLLELSQAAQSFRFTLANMLHARIAYPKGGGATSSSDKREEKSVA